MNHLEHSIEALYETSIKKLRRREEDIHNKTRVNLNFDKYSQSHMYRMKRKLYNWLKADFWFAFL